MLNILLPIEFQLFSPSAKLLTSFGLSLLSLRPSLSISLSLMLCPVAATSYFVFVVVSVLFSGTLGIQETLLKSMQEIFASMHCPHFPLPPSLGRA